MAPVTLRPADERDFGLIASWLAQEEVQRWWGGRDAAFAAVRAALSSPTGLCSIVCVDGEPAGYAQAQDMEPIDSGDLRPLTAGCFRVDVFVGEPRFRRRGIGPEALRLAADEVFSTTLALGLIVIVSVRNEAAVRVYERAGFIWVRVIDDPLFGPSWLMRMDRRPTGPIR